MTNKPGDSELLLYALSWDPTGQLIAADGKGQSHVKMKAQQQPVEGYLKSMSCSH